MAEAIANKLIEQNPGQYGDIRVLSAGLMCAGTSPASLQAIKVVSEHNCDLSKFIAKQITADMAEQADYIFVMTRSHKQMLEYAWPEYNGKVFLLSAYAIGDADAADIPDPYGGSIEEYDKCFSVLQEMITMILEKIRKSNIE